MPAAASTTETEEEPEEANTEEVAVEQRRRKSFTATAKAATTDEATMTSEMATAVEAAKTIKAGKTGMSIEPTKMVTRGQTRGEKRGVEAHEAARHKRTTGVQRELSWDFSWEREKAVCTARKGVGTTSGRITRNMSKGDVASKSKTVSYTKHVYKSLSRGERMLAAARG